MLKTRSTIGILALLLGGLVAGAVVAQAMTGLNPFGVSSEPGGEVQYYPAPDYPTNERGQSFGKIDPFASPDDEPDLIEAVATNGRTGYVDREQMEEVTGGNVASPEDAVAFSEAIDGRGAITIPVYMSDGVTEIGVFEINDAESPAQVIEGTP